MSFDYQARTQTKINDHPIAKLLDNLRMDSAFVTHSKLSEPWGIGMPPISNCMIFHILLEGAAQFKVNDVTFTLKTGDFVLFPKGDGHLLSDGECRSITPLAELPIKTITERYETLEFGGSGSISRMLCSALLFQHPLAIKLLGILPDYIIINADADESSSIVKSISEVLGSETQQIAVGVESVIGRLADILVIAAIRQHLSSLSDDKLSWLSALEDERIGQALKLLHDKPDKHWNLDELAVTVGMSRTSFAQQFKRLVGSTAMDYLTQWRMSLAYSRLQLTNDTQLAIALDIGYQSEPAFNRAFKKVIGKNPGEVRKDYQSVTNHLIPS